MKATKDEVISDLSRINLTLRRKSKERKQALRDIEMMLVCIGGPLNDNLLGYSLEQRKLFHDILKTIKGAL